MNKRPEITDQTRNNLREAFWSLYQTEPVSRITVKKITDLAGYNRATFYHYYSDVYQLLEDEENRLLKEISELLENASKGDELPSRIGPMLEVLVQNNLYAGALLSEHGDPAFVSRLKEMIWPFVQRFFVPERKSDSYDEELLKEFYLSAIFGAVGRWLKNPGMEISTFIGLLVSMISGRP